MKSSTNPLARFAIIIGALAVLVIGLPWLASVYVDLRWFRSLGLESVFSTILGTKLWLGGLAAAIVGATIYANGRLAARLSKGAEPLTIGAGLEGNEALSFEELTKRAPVIFALLAAAVVGLGAAGSWETYLRYVNASEFGTVDPVFGRDIGFYVFHLPFLESLEGFLRVLLLLSVGVAVGVYFLSGGLKLLPGRIQATRPARIHLSVLAAIGFAVLAFDRWLETSRLLFSDLGPVHGASYTDVHATLPALQGQIVVALIAGVLVALSATRKRLFFAGAALVLFFGTELLAVRLYPAMVHRFSVLPNEAQKEAPYIARNIEATRAAYGLDDVLNRDLTGDRELTAADIEANHATIENIRLWDHQPLLDTFAQIQEIRTYYEFASVDNDRYIINGDLRQTMLSVRELNAESLPNQNWINERFTYTHGYGVALGPVNQATPEGLPVLYLQDIPPASRVPELDVTRPQIYFGELSNNHVFVDTEAREFDRPSGDERVYAAYEGRAGVRLDSMLTEAAVATYLGTFKLLLSDDINRQSRVLLHRNVSDRVRSVAPFLTFDSDPYMVVRADGKLAWIQDAYTTTDRFPYAQQGGGFNYIRNSVKVVVDAYEGSVELYVADENDPLIRTWQRIFPVLFKPISEMPSDLVDHLRHPEDLFRVQTEMFTVYHMDDPEHVYSREDQWEVPSMGTASTDSEMEPYYTVMRLPEEDTEEFILMIPYTPANKANLAAWMVARNDGDNRGQLIVYRFPKDRLVFGPQQILNRINQDAEISRQVSLWDQRGSQAIFGTLLVIPIEESLVYVAPLYLRSEGGRIPELKRVIAVYENNIAMAETLDAAVAAAFGSSSVAVAAEQEEQPATTTPSTTAMDADTRIRAATLFDRAIAAQREGDWAGYGAAIEELGQTLHALAQEAEESSSLEEHQDPVPEGAADQQEQEAP